MTVSVDLSPNSSLHFEREKREATTFLKERKGLIFELNFGKDPLLQPIEAYRIALREAEKELIDPLKSVIKAIELFPLTPQFFLEPLKGEEKIEFHERGAFRVDLFRRDLLSDFLGELAPLIREGIPLKLSVSGPIYWLHPTKFSFVNHVPNSSPIGLLLPSLESDSILNRFEKLELSLPAYRLLTEENLPLNWEGLETLWFIPEGVSKLGMRALKGFEAAGGYLNSFC